MLIMLLFLGTLITEFTRCSQAYGPDDLHDQNTNNDTERLNEGLKYKKLEVATSMPSKDYGRKVSQLLLIILSVMFFSWASFNKKLLNTLFRQTKW